MREEDLAKALDVSRTPVRESLRRLSDEHLLRRTANRGSIVEAMTIDDVSAIYDVREVLEGLAVHTVTSRLPHGLLASLVEIHEALIEATDKNDTAQEVKLNVDFHRAIRAGTGNAYLIQFLERAENVVRRSGVTIYSSPERLARNVAEHGAIIEAIASGDADRARDVAVEHMRRAREARIRALLGQLSRPQAAGTAG
jgi:DNA-binding GntR family transcriptional regulator